MARTSYILSAIAWQEQVTFCQLYHGKNKLQFDEMMRMSTLYYSRPTRLVEYFIYIYLTEIDSNIILIVSQPVLVFAP
jgi:hypothetical protein